MVSRQRQNNGPTVTLELNNTYAPASEKQQEDLFCFIQNVTRLFLLNLLAVMQVHAPSWLQPAPRFHEASTRLSALPRMNQSKLTQLLRDVESLHLQAFLEVPCRGMQLPLVPLITLACTIEKH